MTDIGLFLRQGWQNIGKQKSILFFAAISGLGPPSLVLANALGERLNQNAPLLALLLILFGWFAYAYLEMVGAAGRTFAAFSAADGEDASIAATWEVVRRSWRKVFLLYCILVACMLPFLCVIIVLSSSKPPQPARLPHFATLLGLALTSISALSNFWLAGIVARGMGIRESFRPAWTEFSRHFWPLVCMGAIASAGLQVLTIVIGILALLLKSGFGVGAVLRTIDYVAPGASLGSYVPYQLMWAVLAAAYYAMLAAVFMAAYVKYSKARATVIKSQ